MDWIRLGLSYRALRIRLGWRQTDLAERAGVSRDVVSNIERGLGGRVSASTLARVAHALDARLDITLRWRGEALDRLLDASHAMLVERVVEILTEHGWELAIEVSFAFEGERGSIDILAFHRTTNALLVVEVKSVVPDSQAMLHALDRKARLASRVAAERGWPVATVQARLVVVGEGMTSRRRIHALAATYRVALPARGVAVRRWLRERRTPRRAPVLAIRIWGTQSANDDRGEPSQKGRDRGRSTRFVAIRGRVTRMATIGIESGPVLRLVRPTDAYGKFRRGHGDAERGAARLTVPGRSAMLRRPCRLSGEGVPCRRRLRPANERDET